MNIFSRAADAIRMNGWCQGEYKNRAGQLCIVGAIMGAVSPDRDLDLGERILLETEAIHKIEARIHCLASRWNDAPERTEEEVLALLDALAGAKS